MSSWRECKLGDICTDISYGYTASAKSENVGPKFLRITDIVPDRITWGNVPFCEIDDKKKEQYKLEIGDIVIARTGATTGYNKVIKDDIDSVFASYLIRYKIDKQQAFPKFIGYSLQSYEWKGFVEGIIGGSAQPGANAKQFASYDILLPPLEEQKAIAEVLSSLDDKIDLLHHQNKTLESLAQTFFRQWFIEEVKEEWEIKFSDAPIQIIDGDRGNNYPKNSDFFTNEYCLFLSARNVTKNGFDFSDCQFITKERDELLRKGKLSRNDVVLTTRGTVGNIAYYHELIPFENIRINSGMVILRADETKISPLYLYILMKSPLFCESVIEHTSGSAQPQLPIRDLNNVSFILPPKNIYYKFMEQVKPIYSKVFNNQKQIQTLEKLRDTLLPKLLSGEVRIVL
ncbi:restriction endonuclease subunit S [Aliarcobacter butzleri]|uniref:Restriction endonuclease subunit S n=1 Tax=Aliarcobacter butzleri TaxID=28197 RepID=A0AAW7Q148_9BACT|nr:restriction endonuclease subunit S [Aliarcobacter butzleri]MDN5071752.1 restriction endonuclease subunit S [Aliarcobacter butzleri]